MEQKTVIVVPPSLDPEGFRIMAKMLGYTDRWIDLYIELDKVCTKRIQESK